MRVVVATAGLFLAATVVSANVESATGGSFSAESVHTHISAGLNNYLGAGGVAYMNDNIVMIDYSQGKNSDGKFKQISLSYGHEKLGFSSDNTLMMPYLSLKKNKVTTETNSSVWVSPTGSVGHWETQKVEKNVNKNRVAVGVQSQGTVVNNLVLTTNIELSDKNNYSAAGSVSMFFIKHQVIEGEVFNTAGIRLVF
ncbi:hypothetical protein [Arcobacter sp. FWKO B]|uniref:hypothetical protein n=1 Tax=Arcobacter sp. FWKO B TaxID=2593672 RepID=UPI0018A65F42|nr:hypothetical protein [Arcobacter sp. FWKO B]QOG13032.1 hypothetical protein FWKOB_10180 [Arcobacter sp. FWKO B]